MIQLSDEPYRFIHKIPVTIKRKNSIVLVHKGILNIIGKIKFNHFRYNFLYFQKEFKVSIMCNLLHLQNDPVVYKKKRIGIAHIVDSKFIVECV